MRNFLLFVIFMSISNSGSASNAEDKYMIELRARCIEGNPCYFTGEMFALELELFNAGSEPVALPIEYLRRRGPRVTLVDNHSGKEERLGMGPPKAHLIDKLQTVAPGEMIRIPWWIPDSHIVTFALRPIDITAKFTFHLTPRKSFEDSTFVSSQLHIVDGRWINE